MFNPTLQTRLVIGDREYRFSPHPVVPTLVWGQEGRHAIVYRLQSNGDAYALKVFRPAFRHDGLLTTANALWTYRELPGMRVCQQIVITEQTHPELVRQHEDLNYAMLMPWIDGETWFDFLQSRKKVSLDQSRLLAESMAWVLYALELNQLAHCDLSSGNVIVTPDMLQLQLVDVEDLYSPWLIPPPMVPAGSIGYQHSEVARTGQWGPLGDRFAGAVLLAEMLGWAHPQVRKAAWGESFFAPDELQKDSERYQLLCKVLRVYDPGFAEAFEQAWRSRSLEECPPLKTWYDLLDSLPREPVVSWAPINPREFEEAEARPPKPAPRKASGGGAAAKKGVPIPATSVTVKPANTSRRGCRLSAAITLVLALLCCYAAFVAFEWAFLRDMFR